MEEKIYEIIEENNKNVPLFKYKKSKKKRKIFWILASSFSIPITLVVALFVLLVIPGGFLKGGASNADPQSAMVSEDDCYSEMIPGGDTNQGMEGTTTTEVVTYDQNSLDSLDESNTNSEESSSQEEIKETSSII